MVTCGECEHWQPLAVGPFYLGHVCELHPLVEQYPPGTVLEVRILGEDASACKAFIEKGWKWHENLR
jgi:hypothetical protein